MIGALQQIGRWAYINRIPLVPLIINGLIRMFYRCAVFSETAIGKGTKFGYGGIAVVIHKRAVIGRYCAIGPRVTIGGRSGHYEVPVIGDHTRIHSGAVVVGPIKVGRNVTIGANAVVIHDVPDNAIVAGVPAKIVGYNTVPASQRN